MIENKNTLRLEIKKRMMISEIADQLGISTKTLVRLEKMGKTPKAKRDWRGWRVYDHNDFMKIKNLLDTVFIIE